MRAKRLTKKSFLVLFIMIITIMGNVMTAFAYDSVTDVANKYGPGGSKGNTEWPSSLAAYFIPAGTSTIDANKMSTVTCNNVLYYYNTSDTSVIISKAKGLDGDEAVDQLDDYYNLQADVAGAAGLLSGIQQPFQTFLGALVTVITVGATVFTALDLMYITFPVFRGKMDDAKASGTKGLTRQGKNGETKLNWITEDAQYAMIAADTVQSGKSPYIIYFKKRVIALVVLAVVLFILLTGNINILTNIGIKLAAGILDMISSTFN